MENVISKHDEVAMFQTSVTSYRDGSITIYFKEPHEKDRFPYQLKHELESNALNLGGTDWSIYGLGIGFSNQINNESKNSKILLEG